jgi:hypothetical protein
MDSKEMGKLIRGAVDIVNRLSDEVETMFGEFCRLSALVEPLAWVPSGRTYGRYFTAGRATQPRPLPQTLYRVFLPSAGAPTSEMYGPEQDDEKVHLRLKPDTRVLVMAVQLYEAHQSGDVEPDLLAAELSDFVFEGSSAGLTQAPQTDDRGRGLPARARVRPDRADGHGTPTPGGMPDSSACAVSPDGLAERRCDRRFLAEGRQAGGVE